MATKTEINIGFGIGNILAAVISWTANHSIGWAILHTLLGWWYVIYFAIFKWHH